MAVKYLPKGRSTISPYLIVLDAAGLTQFLKTAFDARQIDHVSGAFGDVRNAEVKIGDTVVMVSEAPDRGSALASAVHIYVPDVDATFGRAVEAGATPLREPQDQFYGERVAAVLDPAGNQWWIATRFEKVTAKELKKRIADLEQP
jgi:uncharacterized glyoxalase superfamily protein PhnB